MTKMRSIATLGIEGFVSFRGRDLDDVWWVDVYRNLPEQRLTGRVRWSIRDTGTGLVLGHADKLALAGVRVHVNTAAQGRIAAGGARSVHAWVHGRLTFCPTDSSPWYLNARRVVYRPHEGPDFRCEQSDQVFATAGMMRFDDRGAWVSPASFH